MNRPPLEVADLVRAAGRGFIERSRRWITWQHIKVLRAIVRCRTAALGGHLDETGCQGILLRGEVLFIEVDAKALNPLKTTSIHNAARMVESCATNPIRGGPARKPT